MLGHGSRVQVARLTGEPPIAFWPSQVFKERFKLLAEIYTLVYHVADCKWSRDFFAAERLCGIE